MLCSSNSHTGVAAPPQVMPENVTCQAQKMYHAQQTFPASKHPRNAGYVARFGLATLRTRHGLRCTVLLLYAQVELTELEAGAAVESRDGTGMWRFWQANEKKTDGGPTPTTSLLPVFPFSRQEAAGEGCAVQWKERGGFWGEPETRFVQWAPTKIVVNPQEG